MYILAQTNRVINDLKGAIEREVSSNHYRPLNCLTFLTYRCTSRCQCCNIWKKPIKDRRKEMSFQKWKTVIDKLSKSGVSSVEIFGGDALLRKDVIYDFISHCTSKDIDTYFPTNCNLIDYNTSKSLINSGLKEIYISLDGTEKVHDNIRGHNGSYKKAIKVITDMANLKSGRIFPQIVVNTTISNLNYKYLQAFLDEIAYFPVDRVDLGLLSEIPDSSPVNSKVCNVKPEPFFVSSNGDSHIFSEDQAYEFYKIRNSIIKKSQNLPYELCLSYINLLSIRNLKQGTFPQSTCLRATIKPTITPYGDVIPCPFFTKYILGNIYEDELDNIWGNDSHKKFMMAQRSGKLEICRHCNIILFQRGIKLTLINYLKHFTLGLRNLRN